MEYLTVYAFSTENWKRPADEVNTIMGLLKQYMLEAIDSMERDQIRLRFLGDLSALSPELQELARRTNEISSHIQGFQANVCLNYGGRDELLRAARHFAADCVEGRCRRRNWMRSDSPATCLRTVSRIRSSSSAPAERSRCRAFCCGSAPIRSCISAIPCGRTSGRRIWTGPSWRISSVTAGSAG